MDAMSLWKRDAIWSVWNVADGAGIVRGDANLFREYSIPVHRVFHHCRLVIGRFVVSIDHLNLYHTMGRR